jgi:hypothetical protein
VDARRSEGRRARLILICTSRLVECKHDTAAAPGRARRDKRSLVDLPHLLATRAAVVNLWSSLKKALEDVWP